VYNYHAQVFILYYLFNKGMSAGFVWVRVILTLSPRKKNA